MFWGGEQCLSVGKFIYCIKIQYCDMGFEMFYYVQVVGDKQIGQILVFFGFKYQVQNLCLNGYVQCVDWFVGDDKFWING